MGRKYRSAVAAEPAVEEKRENWTPGEDETPGISLIRNILDWTPL